MAESHGLTALRVEGGLFPPEFLLTVARGEAGHQDPADYGLTRSLALRDEIGRAFRIAVDLWTDFRGRPDDPGTVDRWLAPFLTQALGLRGLTPRKTPIELDGRRFPITHEAVDGTVPLVLVPPAFGLDRPDARFGDESRRRRPLDLVQELLNASDDRLFGIVSDGRVLRILRNNPNFTRPAWIEIDLERVLEDRIFSDLAAFWMLAHGSRLEPRESGNPAGCILERWRHTALQTGERARTELRKGVERALLSFGQGFVRHPDNDALRSRLADGTLTPEDLNRQLLRLVYRCVFLFVAEDRELLHRRGTPDDARRLWRDGYGIGQLRERSLRRRLHDRHGDLWQGLQIAFRALERGAPEIGAPALGGLFRREQCADLHDAALDNASLLTAIRWLAFFRPPKAKALARVNYRDMGTEELGSVYEGLLELHPKIEREPWGFSYVGLNGDVTRGNERKLSGSYYTPDSLVQELVKSALEPVMLKAMTDQPHDRREALLSLKVLDPACGSGHFLLAAARRIAADVATIDAAPDAPTESQRQHALREVVQHCIHGVDKNPLAVELCKTALWIETALPGKPLSFLDHRIREGDSLIGVFDLDVLEDGIPDEAYKPKTGDDKTVARDLLKRNRDERKGQRTFTFGAPGALRRTLDRLAEAGAGLAALPEDDLAAVATKHRAFQDLRADPERLRLRAACDLWAGAFFTPLRKPNPGEPERIPTTDVVRKALACDLPQAFEALCWELGEHKLLHWPIVFPEVFVKGGFDVVLGNPPWEVLQLSEEEFFATRDDRIAKAPNKAGRERLIKALATSDDPGDRKLHRDFEQALHAAEAQGEFVRGSGRSPLTAVGKLNTYALFAELFLRLIAERGRAGIIVPLGIATDDSTKRFFDHLVSTACLGSLLAFENEEFTFRGLHHAYRFALLTLRGDGRGTEPEFAFFCRRAEHLADHRRRFTLSPEDIALINPNTRTCPIFRTGVDAELTKRLYSSVPVLIDERKGDAGNPWGISFRQGLFDMASDSGLFVTTEQLRDNEKLRNEPNNPLIHNIFDLAKARNMRPLYEAKMIHHFDHRWAGYTPEGQSREPDEADKRDPTFRVLPHYWVDAVEVEARLVDRGWSCGWLMGWRDITGIEKVRTVIASAIPRVAVGHTLPLFFADAADPPLAAAFLANWSSLVLDFIARQKVGGTHLTFAYLKQFPFLPPSAYTERDLAFIVARVLELTYTACDMQPFARDLGYDGPPFAWDPDRRAELRAELDAYYAWLYGLTRDELRYVLDPADVMGEDFPSETFRVLKQREMRELGEYRTRRLVLDAFDRFHEDGTFDPARTRDPHYLPEIQKAYSQIKADLATSEQQRSELELLYRNLLARADATRKPVLFVEGETDVPVIEAAWEVFFPGEPRPFEVLVAGGTTQMQALATPGKAMRKLLGDRIVMALADNDGAGRSLWNEGNLHKGGVWKQQTNGVHWCLLPPSGEFRAVMEQLGVTAAHWPCLLENTFSAAIRREAMADSAYAFSEQLFDDLGRAHDLVRKLPALFKDLPGDDPAWLYLLAPTPEAKDTFAAWITAPKRRTPEVYASFEVVMERLKQLLERNAAQEGLLARML